MEITAKNAPDALYEVASRLKLAGRKEASRNGEVLALPEPLMLTILNPRERVVTDPTRDANPFFHIAEAVWMLGGGQGLEFVQYYNSGMARYSDDGKTLHGAYGHRWRKHFFRDQLHGVIELLSTDPDTRRAYIGMFDPEVDHGNILDIPCNTGLAFRVIDNALDMTVFNRSNDILWGMLGANVVHMTVLQEVIAHGIGRPVGRYRVVSNNPHTYTANPQSEAMLASTGAHDCYRHHNRTPAPLLHSHETATGFLKACERVVAFPWQTDYGYWWLDNVYIPMRNTYKARKDRRMYEHNLPSIQSDDWQLACTEWCSRRD